MALKDTQVITGKVRLSYANVFKARAMNEGETPKYGSAILIPKSDKLTLKKIEAAVNKAKIEGKASKFGGKIPATLKLPLRDGDEEHPDDENYAGMMFLNANNSRRPAIVDRDRNPITEEDDEVYSGVYGRAVLSFFPFAGKSKGIAASFDAFQKTADGERLSGGSVDIDEVFGDEFDDEDDI